MGNFEIVVFILMLAVSYVFVYFLGKKHGIKDVIKELDKEIKPTLDLIGEVLNQGTEQRNEYIFAINQIDANKGKIPTKEVYDILYKNHLVEGKVYCSCESPDTCDVFRVLREYRTKYKHMFSEEELNKKDGL